MATSKELRNYLREHHQLKDEADTYTPFAADVVRLLDALDAEEAKGIVGYVTVPLPMWTSETTVRSDSPPAKPLDKNPPDDEGEVRTFNPDGGEMCCRVVSPDILLHSVLDTAKEADRRGDLLRTVLREVRSRLPESLVNEIEEELNG